MSTKSFKAASTSFWMYGGVLKDLIEEIGMEKTVAIHAKRGKEFGAQLASGIKNELGSKKINLAAWQSYYAKALDAIGIKPAFDKKRSVLKTSVHQCPVYEGLMNAGLDHDTIGKMCTQMSVLEYEELKKNFPAMSVCLKFRSTPEEPCVENFTIIKG